MNSTLKVIGVSLAAFAVYLPIAYFSGRDYLPTPRPEGAVVETLLKIDKGQGFSYLAQSFSLAKYADDSEDNMKSPVILYEDSTRARPRPQLPQRYSKHRARSLRPCSTKAPSG
jgi:hypothetical protein